MRREDSKALEPSVEEHARADDAALLSAFEAWKGQGSGTPSPGEAQNPPNPPPPPPPPSPLPTSRMPGMAAASPDDLFRALGQALDEIEQEQKAERSELMRPTKDVAERRAGRESRYRQVTRWLIGATDPLLQRTSRTAVRSGGKLVTSVDRDLEELLTLSIDRARLHVERRRAEEGPTRWRR